MRAVSLFLLAGVGVAHGGTNDPVNISCGGSFRDGCFDCGLDFFDREDNDCRSYPQAGCGQPGGGDNELIFRIQLSSDHWVQVNSDWGNDITFGGYLQRGSSCNNTIQCASPREGGPGFDPGWEAEAGQAYYLAFEETDADSFWPIADWDLNVRNVACCPDNDGDGTYAYNSACSQMPTSLRDCNDSDPSNRPGGVEVCDGRDNNCNGQSDEGLPFTTYYRDAEGDGFGNATATLRACAQPAGYVTNAGDCDDTESRRRPGLAESCDGLDNDCDNTVDEGVQSTFYRDVDADGYGNPAVTTRACSAPGGYTSNNTDCDDGDPARRPGLPETCDGKDNDCNNQIDDGVGGFFYRDFDRDGAGNPAISTQSCSGASGFVADSSDCDDNDAQRRPGLPEVCDGKDNDCNQLIDDGAGTPWFLDRDQDGYGDDTSRQIRCVAPSGFIARGNDCDDFDNQRRPGLGESCDGKDNDCNELVDDGVGAWWFVDADEDGYGNANVQTQACTLPDGHSAQPGDCDDQDEDRRPGLPEVCDGKDNNCNTTVDESPTDGTIWYRDADEDGFGNGDVSVTACQRPLGYVINGDDCDDVRDTVFPTASELPYDGIDQDCRDGDECDVDDDGFLAEAGLCGGTDCADGDPAIKPGATELMDGVDNDCDGLVDEDSTAFDDDGDGWTEQGGDCDDSVAAVHPGAVETCNGIDEDCDGTVDEHTRCYDDDEDGYSEDEGDCHDGDAFINPDAIEDPTDGVDNDCDGIADAVGQDTDQDGFTEDGGDCDPNDPNVNPAEVEVADGVDNDCDGTIDEETEAYDDDGDGYSEDEGDCDDDDADISPNEVEIDDNGRDDDCNGITDDGGPSYDDDGDGLSEIEGDCDDTDPDVRPGEAEVDNGIDDDCDGVTDEGIVDADGDGYATTDGDCNDNNGWVHPGAAELCDGVDNDCDDERDEGCGDVQDTGDTGTEELDARCACRSGPASLGLFPVLIGLLAVRRRR